MLQGGKNELPEVTWSVTEPDLTLMSRSSILSTDQCLYFDLKELPQLGKSIIYMPIEDVHTQLKV